MCLHVLRVLHFNLAKSEVDQSLKRRIIIINHFRIEAWQNIYSLKSYAFSATNFSVSKLAPIFSIDSSKYR